MSPIVNHHVPHFQSVPYDLDGKRACLAWTISHGRVNFHVRLYGVRDPYFYVYSCTVAHCAKALQRVLTTYSCIVK